MRGELRKAPPYDWLTIPQIAERLAPVPMRKTLKYKGRGKLEKDLHIIADETKKYCETQGHPTDLLTTTDYGIFCVKGPRNIYYRLFCSPRFQEALISALVDNFLPHRLLIQSPEETEARLVKALYQSPSRR